MSLQAVIFDMDGVLASTVGFHYNSWKKVLGEYGIEISEADNVQLLGLSRRRSLEVLLGKRDISEEQLQEMLERKNAYYQEFIQEIGPRDLGPGVSTLLQELRLAHIRIGVASASQNVRYVLQQLGIDGFIQALMDGAAVRRSKPAPDIFLETARALNVKPGSCLVIEDSAAGIQAAGQAGMVVVGLGMGEQIAGAHWIIPDLAQIHLKDLREIFDQCRAPESASADNRNLGVLV